MTQEEYNNQLELGTISSDTLDSKSMAARSNIIPDMSFEELDTYIEDNIRKYGGVFNFECALIFKRLIKEIQSLKK